MKGVKYKRMSEAPDQEIKLFYCYAREDEALRDELELHLSSLKRRYHLVNWHDRKILPGAHWEEEVDEHINNAHLILLLISPNFLASSYCYSKEM
jgi:TIR domain